MAFNDPGNGRVIYDMAPPNTRSQKTVGEACQAGDVLGFKLVSASWVRACAAVGENHVEGKVVALEDGVVGEKIWVSHSPVIEGYSGAKVGGAVYVTDFEGLRGRITQTVPTEPGEIDTPIGIALTETRVRFHLATFSYSVVL